MRLPYLLYKLADIMKKFKGICEPGYLRTYACSNYSVIHSNIVTDNKKFLFIRCIRTAVHICPIPQTIYVLSLFIEQKVSVCNFDIIISFNPLAYTDVPETAGLARSINP